MQHPARRRVPAAGLQLPGLVLPLAVGGTTFVLNSLLDIAHEQKLAFLEKVFLHDVLNSANAIKGVGHLLRALAGQTYHTEVDLLLRAVNQLTDLVLYQREFASAERHDYAVAPVRLDSRAVVEEAVALIRGQRIAFGRGVAVDPDFADAAFTADRRLLDRVLHNMLRNALEACAPGEAATIGCRAGDGRVRFLVHNPAVMAEAVQLQLFKRSFSTKGEGRGLGTYSMKLFGETYLGGRVTFTSTTGRARPSSWTCPATARSRADSYSRPSASTSMARMSPQKTPPPKAPAPAGS